MNSFKKKIFEIKKIFKTKVFTDYSKVISLTYLTCAIEEILTNPKEKNPVKKINVLLDDVKKILFFFKKFEPHQIKNKIKFYEAFKFKKNHLELWQKIWPDYLNDKDFKNLIEYRGKRLDFNKITEFRKKEILDVGCGNGSITFACLKRGAKGAIGVDFGKNNLKLAKFWSKKYGYNHRTKFIHQDILKLKINKKFDFIVCSAVLHHLKNHREIKRVLKKISLHCKIGGHFYFFVRGQGGMRYLIQDMCQELLKNVDQEFIKKILVDLNFNQNKITHLLDWHKAIYLQTDKNKLLAFLKQIGFDDFRRLKGPHKNDMDLNQLKYHIKSSEKFGTGELRYICKKIN